ncbi:MAG: hypothetical protein A4E72_01922 [Syntrophus sp. PtaU1.Bin208]|nr:MAG: hypothetical protein A4E72_01922 [Syntrophus sp. PtaU1.Bin208]
MRREFLGDSYDAVKRMWQDILAPWAPLYAEPRFIPAELRSEFTLLTRIPMLLETPPDDVFSILNDPDTGIRLPAQGNQSEGRTHISINSIADQLRIGAVCVVTFDQSDYRNNGMKRNEQRRAKMIALAQKGLYSFYYVSHAPFLFTVSDQYKLSKVRELIKNAGIPKNRLENIDVMPNR